MKWKQEKLHLRPRTRGFHLITGEVEQGMPAIANVRVGLLHLFIQHTSASLTLSENADSDVLLDMEMATNRIVQESFPYRHVAEGSDDMPAHVKSSLFGSSLSIPITDGRLALGTWQGIVLCEHRDHAPGRSLVGSVFGSVSG